MPRTYYVYILASASRTLYVGVTNDIIRRVRVHRARQCAFTCRYRIRRLVYLEATTDVRAAIAREKQLKAFRREKKTALVSASNPRQCPPPRPHHSPTNLATRFAWNALTPST